MDQLGAMRTFVEIVDQGSLSAASRHLQISLPVVVRTLAALERRLDVRLLNRTTRRIHLTEAGAEFYQRCKHIASEVEEAEQYVSAQRHIPSGTLVVTAPLLFGRLHVVPLRAYSISFCNKGEDWLNCVDETKIHKRHKPRGVRKNRTVIG